MMEFNESKSFSSLESSSSGEGKSYQDYIGLPQSDLPLESSLSRARQNLDRHQPNIFNVHQSSSWPPSSKDNASYMPVENAHPRHHSQMPASSQNSGYPSHNVFPCEYTSPWQLQPPMESSGCYPLQRMSCDPSCRPSDQPAASQSYIHQAEYHSPPGRYHPWSSPLRTTTYHQPPALSPGYGRPATEPPYQQPQYGGSYTGQRTLLPPAESFLGLLHSSPLPQPHEVQLPGPSSSVERPYDESDTLQSADNSWSHIMEDGLDTLRNVSNDVGAASQHDLKLQSPGLRAIQTGDLERDTSGPDPTNSNSEGSVSPSTQLRNLIQSFPSPGTRKQLESSTLPPGQGYPYGLSDVGTVQRPVMYPQVSNVESGRPVMYPHVSNVESGRPVMYPQVSKVESGRPVMYSQVSKVESGRPVMYPHVSNVERVYRPVRYPHVSNVPNIYRPAVRGPPLSNVKCGHRVVRYPPALVRRVHKPAMYPLLPVETAQPTIRFAAHLPDVECLQRPPPARHHREDSDVESVSSDNSLALDTNALFRSLSETGPNASGIFQQDLDRATTLDTSVEDDLDISGEVTAESLHAMQHLIDMQNAAKNIAYDFDPAKKPQSLLDAITMYIDFLIWENENKTLISQCAVVKMMLNMEKEAYYKDIVSNPMPFPTSKFRNWLKNFSVDIEITDMEGNISHQTVFAPSVDLQHTSSRSVLNEKCVLPWDEEAENESHDKMNSSLDWPENTREVGDQNRQPFTDAASAAGPNSRLRPQLDNSGMPSSPDQHKNFTTPRKTFSQQISGTDLTPGSTRDLMRNPGSNLSNTLVNPDHQSCIPGLDDSTQTAFRRLSNDVIQPPAKQEYSAVDDNNNSSPLNTSELVATTGGAVSQSQSLARISSSSSNASMDQEGCYPIHPHQGSQSSRPHHLGVPTQSGTSCQGYARLEQGDQSHTMGERTNFGLWSGRPVGHRSASTADLHRRHGSTSGDLVSVSDTELSEISELISNALKTSLSPLMHKTFDGKEAPRKLLATKEANSSSIGDISQDPPDGQMQRDKPVFKIIGRASLGTVTGATPSIESQIPTQHQQHWMCKDAPARYQRPALPCSRFQLPSSYQMRQRGMLPYRQLILPEKLTRAHFRPYVQRKRGRPMKLHASPFTTIGRLRNSSATPLGRIEQDRAELSRVVENNDRAQRLINAQPVRLVLQQVNNGQPVGLIGNRRQPLGSDRTTDGIVTYPTAKQMSAFSGYGPVQNTSAQGEQGARIVFSSDSIRKGLMFTDIDRSAAKTRGNAGISNEIRFVDCASNFENASCEVTVAQSADSGSSQQVQITSRNGTQGELLCAGEPFKPNPKTVIILRNSKGRGSQTTSRSSQTALSGKCLKLTQTVADTTDVDSQHEAGIMTLGTATGSTVDSSSVSSLPSMLTAGRVVMKQVVDRGSQTDAVELEAETCWRIYDTGDTDAQQARSQGEMEGTQVERGDRDPGDFQPPEGTSKSPVADDLATSQRLPEVDPEAGKGDKMDADGMQSKKCSMSRLDNDEGNDVKPSAASKRQLNNTTKPTDVMNGGQGVLAVGTSGDSTIETLQEEDTQPLPLKNIKRKANKRKNATPKEPALVQGSIVKGVVKKVKRSAEKEHQEKDAGDESKIKIRRPGCKKQSRVAAAAADNQVATVTKYKDECSQEGAESVLIKKSKQKSGPSKYGASVSPSAKAKVKPQKRPYTKRTNLKDSDCLVKVSTSAKAEVKPQKRPYTKRTNLKDSDCPVKVSTSANAKEKPQKRPYTKRTNLKDSDCPVKAPKQAHASPKSPQSHKPSPGVAGCMQLGQSPRPSSLLPTELRNESKTSEKAQFAFAAKGLEAQPEKGLRTNYKCKCNKTTDDKEQDSSVHMDGKIHAHIRLVAPRDNVRKRKRKSAKSADKMEPLNKVQKFEEDESNARTRSRVKIPSAVVHSSAPSRKVGRPRKAKGTTLDDGDSSNAQAECSVKREIETGGSLATSPVTPAAGTVASRQKGNAIPAWKAKSSRRSVQSGTDSTSCASSHGTTPLSPVSPCAPKRRGRKPKAKGGATTGSHGPKSGSVEADEMTCEQGPTSASNSSEPTAPRMLTKGSSKDTQPTASSKRLPIANSAGDAVVSNAK